MDIGANIGTTSVYVEKNIGCNLDILAFEPNPEVFKCLKLNTIVNGCKKVKCVNVGISDTKKMKDMLIFRRNSGMSRMETTASHNSAMDKVVGRIKVPAVGVDEYLQENNISFNKVKMVWIDTEGFEPYVIKGMSKLLHRGGFKVPIWMEFSSDIMDQEMFSILYDCLKEVYASFVYYGVDSKKSEQLPIDRLPALWRGSREQYNLFLYK